MRILHQEYEHPTQASRVRLNLYRYAPPAEERVAGMLPGQEGCHITEDRVGSVTVVAGLGFFAQEADARERFARRAEELARQGWRPAATPAPPPSIPPVAQVPLPGGAKPRPTTPA